MNKKFLASFAVSSLLLFQSASTVLAQSPTPTLLRNAQERRDQVLENIANRVEARFNRHEKRLQNWIDRATKHIAEREAAGKDMTNAKKALDTAKSSLENASKLGDEAVAKLRAVTPEAWALQKQDAKAAREAVRTAQVAYAQVVKDMMKALEAMKQEAK